MKNFMQSHALRRQLKSTIRKVKEDIRAKKEETFKNLGKEVDTRDLQGSLDDLLRQSEKVEKIAE